MSCTAAAASALSHGHCCIAPLHAHYCPSTITWSVKQCCMLTGTRAVTHAHCCVFTGSANLGRYCACRAPLGSCAALLLLLIMMLPQLPWHVCTVRWAMPHCCMHPYTQVPPGAQCCCSMRSDHATQPLPHGRRSNMHTAECQMPHSMCVLQQIGLCT
jgi:hypothetical protein